MKTPLGLFRRARARPQGQSGAAAARSSVLVVRSLFVLHFALVFLAFSWFLGPDYDSVLKEGMIQRAFATAQTQIAEGEALQKADENALEAARRENAELRRNLRASEEELEKLEPTRAAAAQAKASLPGLAQSREADEEILQAAQRENGELHGKLKAEILELKKLPSIRREISDLMTRIQTLDRAMRETKKDLRSTQDEIVAYRKKIEDAGAEPPASRSLRAPRWFNCDRKQRGADHVICASPALLDAVARLEDAFQAAQAAQAAKGPRIDVTHQAWLNSYSQSCGLPARDRPNNYLSPVARDCVLNAINAHIEELRNK